QPDEDQISDVINNIDIPDAMIPAITHLMTNDGIVNKHVTDQHIVEMLTEAHKGTWFYIRREASWAAPRSGTRPGVPIADFTFNALMADVTADYHQRATTDGVVVTIPEAPQHFQQSDCTKMVSSTSFVDSRAAMTSNGNEIHQLVSTMWGHLIRSTLSRGLPINTAKSSYIVYPNTKSGKRTARTMTQEKLSIADIGFTATGITHDKMRTQRITNDQILDCKSDCDDFVSD
ncbi:unnamed protein product, partial [Prorocentrum cordatum]